MRTIFPVWPLPTFVSTVFKHRRVKHEIHLTFPHRCNYCLMIFSVWWHRFFPSCLYLHWMRLQLFLQTIFTAFLKNRKTQRGFGQVNSWIFGHEIHKMTSLKIKIKFHDMNRRIEQWKRPYCILFAYYCLLSRRIHNFPSVLFP